MLAWTPWSVEAIYQGLSAIKCRVIWSMKKIELKPKNATENFRFMTWAPQIEILTHPACKAGLNHGGFGSLFEFISGKVPMICFPHCGDQGFNAKTVMDRKIGISLILDPKKCLRNPAEDLTWPTPLFTAKVATEAFKKILEDPQYMRNIEK